jgi:demethylmenaquinone methyltransferase/2-methoxy-6-polyprenyl-1,4-benzoquinol methylase
MFDGIARHYDLLNHVLSANLDRRWRKRALARLDEDDRALILDLCGGTGDLSVELARGRRAGRVVCCDNLGAARAQIHPARACGAD